MLVHYSAKPLAFAALRDVRPEDREQGYLKPRGLWFSVETEEDDGWREWCVDQEFHPECLECRAEITLAPDAKVLWLRTPEELDAFTREYSAPWLPEILPNSPNRTIDWPRVVESYDGIIIAPYCWQRRMTEHTWWYYPWDCASGCIWRVRAIAAVTPLPAL